VPHDKLDEEVAAWCAELMERSPTALAIAKRSFNAATESFRGLASLGMQSLALYYDTEESKEGVRAFNEKRKPDFRKYQP
jgi:2-ketocyclohexanecarboxyl-CoA hydrolase